MNLYQQVGGGGRSSAEDKYEAQAALEQLVDRYGSKSQSESREMLKQRTKSQTISSSLNSNSSLLLILSTAKIKRVRRIKQRKTPFEVSASVQSFFSSFRFACKC